MRAHAAALRLQRSVQIVARPPATPEAGSPIPNTAVELGPARAPRQSLACGSLGGTLLAAPPVLVNVGRSLRGSVAASCAVTPAACCGTSDVARNAAASPPSSPTRPRLG